MLTISLELQIDRCCVRREMLGRFLRVHEADLAEPALSDSSPAPGEETDRVRVDLRFRSLGAAEALLMFGTDAEVLAPDELRAVLARKAAETAALYATGRDG